MKLSILTLLLVGGASAQRRRDGPRSTGGERFDLSAFKQCARYSDCEDVDANRYGEGGCCLLEEETVAYVKVISTQQCRTREDIEAYTNANGWDPIHQTWTNPFNLNEQVEIHCLDRDHWSNENNAAWDGWMLGDDGAWVRTGDQDFPS